MVVPNTEKVSFNEGSLIFLRLNRSLDIVSGIQGNLSGVKRQKVHKVLDGTGLGSYPGPGDMRRAIDTVCIQHVWFRSFRAN